MEFFFGEWSIQVAEKNAWFNQRFHIIGSDRSDGIYEGVVGFTLPTVSGDHWKIIMEWNNAVDTTWQESGMKKTLSYTAEHGLVKLLGADDNVVESRDGDFDDLILRCESLDPSLNPLGSLTNPYDFTFPEKMLREKKQKKDKYGGN